MLAGVLVGDLLMQLAAKVALANHFAGLAMLTLVALAQLVVTVAMFHVLRPGLPHVLAAQRSADKAATTEAQAVKEPGAVDRRGSRLVRMITIALLPFFAYYAAWGFLGDIVRQYSRATLDQADFGQSANVLDVLDSRWLLVSVAVSWLIHRLAKFMQTKTKAASFWQIVVVICETNWIFVGLYVISRWKDSALQWLMSRHFWSALQASVDGLANPVPMASAAPMVPVESIAPSTVAVNLFFFMLLPLIWLVMAALIYGYDVRDDAALMRVHGRLERAGRRYVGLPKFLRDFVEHFIAGYRSRYLPIANGVRLDSQLQSGAFVHAGRRLPLARLGRCLAMAGHDAADRSARARRLADFFAWRDAAVRQPVPGFLHRHPDRAAAHMLSRRRAGDSVFDGEAGGEVNSLRLRGEGRSLRRPLKAQEPRPLAAQSDSRADGLDGVLGHDEGFAHGDDFALLGAGEDRRGAVHHAVRQADAGDEVGQPAAPGGVGQYHLAAQPLFLQIGVANRYRKGGDDGEGVVGQAAGLAAAQIGQPPLAAAEWHGLAELDIPGDEVVAVQPFTDAVIAGLGQRQRQQDSERGKTAPAPFFLGLSAFVGGWFEIGRNCGHAFALVLLSVESFERKLRCGIALGSSWVTLKRLSSLHRRTKFAESRTVSDFRDGFLAPEPPD
ncbi:hypothetical protein [Mesorhizobium sp. M0491]|uniref:hypothetical protein n=1 Tax=Mesorhizobium sp. M0491 TaxID=2956950 RepID=UPI00333B83AB